MAGGSSSAPPPKGLVFWALITSIISTTEFKASGLSGKGTDFFSAGRPWTIYVVRSSAPQGERQLVTTYNTLDGDFQHAAFTSALSVGDEVYLLHPDIAQLGKTGGLTPVENAVAANWNSGVATSGNAGADLVTIGAADVRYKLHSLLINISALTAAATITIRLYMLVNGTEREVYSQTFTVGTDPDGVWVVNGTLGIHEALRVEVHSNNGLDDGAAVDYDYMLEAM